MKPCAQSAAELQGVAQKPVGDDDPPRKTHSEPAEHASFDTHDAQRPASPELASPVDAASLAPASASPALLLDASSPALGGGEAASAGAPASGGSTPGFPDGGYVPQSSQQRS